MKKETIIGTLLAILTVWVIGYTAPKLYDIYKDEPKTEIKVDTVITEKHDTILLKDVKPYSEIHYKKVIDTLRTTDSVFVPVEVPLSLQKYEGDTVVTDGTKVHYRASISGYRQSLDTLWFDVERHDRIITKEVTKWKENKGFKLAPSIGAGYGVINRKPDIYFGVSLSYNF